MTNPATSLWLAPLAFGEAWHNNHHAFPTSARHGLGRGQVDPGAWLIAALERCSSGLGRDPHQPRSATGQARGVRFVAANRLDEAGKVPIWRAFILGSALSDAGSTI